MIFNKLIRNIRAVKDIVQYLFYGLSMDIDIDPFIQIDLVVIIEEFILTLVFNSFKDLGDSAFCDI